MQLQLSLLDHRKLSGSIDSDGMADDYGFTLKQTQYGLASRLAVGLGYGLTQHFEVMLQGALSVRRDSSTLDAGKEDSASVRGSVRTVELLPVLRYVGDEGDRRFYVGAGLGYEGSKRSSGGREQGSVKAFVMSAQAGFYCYLREHVSVDPALELGFVRGSLERSSS